MKKILKKASLLITTFVFTFILIGEVNAACPEGSSHECRETSNRTIVATYDAYLKGVSTTTYKYTNNLHRFSEYGLLVRKPSGSSYSFSDSHKIYFHEDTYANNLAMYCLDADLRSVPNLYAHRFLLRSNSDKTVYAADMGIMSILVNGSKTTSNANSYHSTSIAMRAYTTLFGFHKSGSSDLYKAYFGTLYRWITTDNAVKANYEVIAKNDKNVLSLDYLKKYEGYALEEKDYNNYPILTPAKKLFVDALNEASSYYKNGGGVASVIEDTPVTLSEKIKKEDANGVLVSTEIKHTLTLKNFNNDGKASFKIDSLVYEKGASVVGATKEPTVKSVTINGKELTSNLTGVNLLDGIEITDNIKVEIVLYFEGYESVKEGNTNPILNCKEQPMSYILKYSTNNTGNLADKYSNYVGTVWYGQYASGTGYQRFMTVEPVKNVNQNDDDSQNQGQIKGQVSLVPECNNCTVLEEACVNSKDKNSTACKEYIAADCNSCDDLKTKCEMGIPTDDNKDACEVYAEVCAVTCETTVTPFECCEEETDRLIISEEDNKEVSIKGPTSVNACFVTAIDKKCDNAEEDGDNSCAGIGAQDQKENSYTLAETNNNKYCTVSCKEDYIMQMPTARMVNAGRYFTFKAKVNGTKTCFTNTIDREQFNDDMVEVQSNLIDAYNEYVKWTTALDNIKSDSTYYSKNVKSSTGNGCSSKGACTGYYVSGTYSKTTYSVNKNTGVVTITGNVNDALENESDGGSSANSCPGSCTAGKQSTLESNIKKRIEEAEKKIKEYTESKANIIKDYNGCSSWTTEINYDADVYYDYDENNYMELLKNGRGDMTENVSNITNEEWICNSNVETNGSETTKANLSNSSYTACSNTTSNKVKETSIGYIACTIEGCKVVNENISDARYKKLTSYITADYKPATLFYNIYPSGNITVNKDTEDAVALDNSLPVALNTKRGIYKYTVNIENLGEYYHIGNTKDNLGRYVGGKTAIVGEKLVYACSYLVNMMLTTEDKLYCTFDKCPECVADCIGPNCDNNCDGGNCVADCIGAGCIYDSDAGSSLIEKVVSLNNLFPNGTESYNWDVNENEKAKSAVTAIESKGNKVYEETPILSITINPSTAKEISKYNESDDVINSGGYSNDTVYCRKLGTYERAACYSTFIDDLLTGKYGKNVINDNSKIADSTYRTKDNVTEAEANSKDGYFQLWTGKIDEDSMLGPAWK